jgi:hypothetical protein
MRIYYIYEEGIALEQEQARGRFMQASRRKCSRLRREKNSAMPSEREEGGGAKPKNL